MKNKTKFFCSLLFITVIIIQNGGLALAEKTPQTLRKADISSLIKEPQFDSREYGIITPVKDQGKTSLCWAYSTVNASEASILRSGIDKNASVRSLSLLPEQIGYARWNRGADPLQNAQNNDTQTGDWKNKTGSTHVAASLLSQWCGPVKYGTAPDANGWENSAYKLETTAFINSRTTDVSIAAREKMKKAIVSYGAVTFSYIWQPERDYFKPNPKTSDTILHACTIIGWNDNIPKENFSPGAATQNGGWLVKNSYSDKEYFYLSYDVTSEQSCAFEYVMPDTYDFNYFYDSAPNDFGLTYMKTAEAANIFEAKKGTAEKEEFITAVNVGIDGENTTCTIEVYTDTERYNPVSGTLSAVATENFEYAGYHTITLNTPVKISKGTFFSVIAKVENSDGTAYVKISNNNGNSYRKVSGNWNGYGFIVPRIKAFTKLDDNSDCYLKFAGETELLANLPSEKSTLILVKYEVNRISDLNMISLDAGDFGIKKFPVPAGWKKDANTSIEAFLWSDTLNAFCPKATLE